MARVPYLAKSGLKPADQDLLAREINLNRVLVNSPNGARAFSRLGGFIRNTSTLDARLREMAILQVGYLAKSRYEYSHHIKIGREFGVSDDDGNFRVSGRSAAHFLVRRVGRVAAGVADER